MGISDAILNMCTVCLNTSLLWYVFHFCSDGQDSALQSVNQRQAFFLEIQIWTHDSHSWLKSVFLEFFFE